MGKRLGIALIASLFFSFLPLHLTFSEIIKLKSGKVVEGRIVEKTDSYIKVDFVGVPLVYFFDEIDSIDGESQGNLAGIPKEAIDFNEQGIIYGKEGNSDKAIYYLNKAIEICPGFASAYHNRGHAYFQKGDFDQAIADYNRVIDINPDEPHIYFSRGLTYEAKNELAKAISDYSKAIEANPNDDAAYNNRGLALGKMMENADMALSDFNKAIEINPRCGAAYINRAAIYFYKKQYDEAWEDVRRGNALGVKINPEFTEMLEEASGRKR